LSTAANTTEQAKFGKVLHVKAESGYLPVKKSDN